MPLASLCSSLILALFLFSFRVHLRKDWQDVEERLVATRKAVHWKRGLASLKKSKKPFFFSPTRKFVVISLFGLYLTSASGIEWAKPYVVE